MRIVALATLLALSGCATGGPTSYRQAAAPAPVGPPPAYTPGFAPGTPAAPVYTPAGAGLPTPGQPGYAGDDVRRSPNRRVLPATAEPGVWAADEVNAVRKSDDGAANDPVPTLAESRALAMTGECKAEVAKSESDIAIHKLRKALSPDENECVTALIFHYCAHRTLNLVYDGKVPATQDGGRFDLRNVDNRFWAARRWKNKVCLYVDRNDPRIVEILSRLMGRFDEVTELPQ